MSPFLLSYKWLSFSKPTNSPWPVPRGLERYWIDTHQGRLEILHATLAVPATGPPIFFCHGGMGGAWVWIEYMTYLSSRGIACYAISLRGHGDSWHPSYLRMLFATSRRMLCDDLVTGIEWVQAREGSEVMLVGHSSGGGLSQAVLSEGRVHAKALALLGAVPAYGSMGVYVNWARLDPWFTLRMVFHAWHSNSPLSHPALTQRAFFGDSFPSAAVLPFQQRLCPYESFLWPISMVSRFASASSVLKHVGTGNTRELATSKLLVMAGSQDKLITPTVTEETAAFYRAAPGMSEKTVCMELVNGAGHHLQNDVQWEDGAMRLLAFYNNVFKS